MNNYVEMELGWSCSESNGKRLDKEDSREKKLNYMDKHVRGIYSVVDISGYVMIMFTPEFKML